MKFLIVTVANAALAQLSGAGAILRQKRSDAFVENFEDTIRTVKTFVPHSETLFRNCLKDIPKTAAYAKYIHLFEGYLKDIQQLKNTPGNCFEKAIAGLEKMVQFVETVDAIDPEKETTEAKEISRILGANGGDQFAEDLRLLTTKLLSLKIDNELEEITTTDAFSIAPMLTQVC